MLRLFNFLVETSDWKTPAEHTLGRSDVVLTPNVPGDGEIPRNVRLALTITELVQPYVHWGTSPPPAPCSSSECTTTVRWHVGGAVYVDSTYVVVAPWPHSDVVCDASSAEAVAAIQVGGGGAYTSAAQHGATEWGAALPPNKAGAGALPKHFDATLSLTGTSTSYVLQAKAQVDQAWKTNPGAMPVGTSPQSHVVNARTNLAWNMQVLPLDALPLDVLCYLRLIAVVRQVASHKVQAQTW